MTTINRPQNPIEQNQNENPEQHPRLDQPYITNISETLRKIDSAPSTIHHHPDTQKPRQIPVDSVEEELMESFPASDPPAHTKNRLDKPEPRRPGQED